MLVQNLRNPGQNILLEKRYRDAFTRWPPCTLAHRRAGRKRGEGPGSPTDDVAEYPRQFCLTTRTPLFFDVGEQLGKGPPRLDGVGGAAGTVNKSRIAQHSKVG